MRPPCRIVLLCALLALVAAPLRPVRAGAETLPPSNPILAQAIQTARAIPPAPMRATALVRVAEACARLGRPDQARQALTYAQEAALKPTALASGSAVEVGKAWLQVGFPDDALDLAARLPLSGSRLDLTIAVADACIASGHRPEADAALHAAIAAYTPSVDPVLAAQALAAAAARSDEGTGRPYLEQAAQLASSFAPRDRSAALADIAHAYARQGDDAAALRTALQIDDPVGRAAAMAATALELAGRDEAAAVARVQQVSDAGRRADPAPLSRALADAARQASDADRKDLARALLRAAEGAGSRADGDTRQTLLRNVANLYGTLLGDWPEALRVAQDAGDDWTARASRAHVVIQLAAAGQIERAAPLFRTAAADKVSYIGLNLMNGLAGAYFQIEPGAGIDQVMTVEPQELRDHILAVGARRALDAGDAATALDWARHIAFNGVSEEVLYQSAGALLAGADAAGLPAAVREARKVSTALRSDQRRQGLLFEIGKRYVALGQTKAAQAVIAEFDKISSVAEGDPRSLTRMAILEQMAGRPDDARERLAKALVAAEAVDCGSCRELALIDMLKDLLTDGDMALLQQAAQRGSTWALAAQQVIQVLDGLPGLSAERRRLALRIALHAAGTERTMGFNAEAIAQVAVAWHDQGLTPGPEDLAVLPAPPPPAPEGEAPALAARADFPVTLVYFERSGCAECRDVNELLDRIRKKTPNLNVTRYELDPADPKQKKAVLLNETFCAVFKVAERDRLVAPAIFSARAGLIGRDITEASLTGLIQAARGLPGPESLYAPRADQAQESLRSRFASLGLLVVMGAGLVDGVNPCAFTVIIFFLSYLAFLGRGKREILAAGIFFTIANFLTYLAIGLFLTGAVRFGEQRSAAFAHALYAATAAVVLVAAALSLRDAIRCLQGRAKEMTLVLPQKLQSTIRRNITTRARLGLTVGAMAFLGSVVALVSFPCTGQVYAPTIVFALHNLPQFRWGALGWLIIYNLFFILPLVGVFILVLFGLTSEKLTAVFRRHLAATKFALAGLFAVFFAVMVYQLT